MEDGVLQVPRIGVAAQLAQRLNDEVEAIFDKRELEEFAVRRVARMHHLKVSARWHRASMGKFGPGSEPNAQRSQR